MRAISAERGMCAALGCAIAVCIVFAMQWPLWALMPACGVGAGVFFRPWEVFATLRMEVAPWLTLEWVGRFLSGTIPAVYFVGYVTIAVLLSALLTCLVVHAGILIAQSPTKEDLDWYVYAFMGFLWTVMGLAFWEKFGRWNQDGWAFPLLRRLSRVVPAPDSIFDGANESMWTRLRCAIVHVFIGHIWAVVFLSIFVVDCFLTVMIAAATTQRLSLMAGGTIGGACGFIAGLYGADHAGVSLACITAGGAMGYLWYPLAQVLKRPAESDCVLSAEAS